MENRRLLRNLVKTKNVQNSYSGLDAITGYTQASRDGMLLVAEYCVYFVKSNFKSLNNETKEFLKKRLIDLKKESDAIEKILNG